MGSVGFVDDEESRPGTNNSKKYKSPKKILDDCSAVNYASVPRKLRSAIKKRARESITPSLPISRKNNHLSNGVATLKKSAKKSKLNKKQKRMTKDEKEVAETLYALADMFSDACNTNKLALDDETKSSTIIEDSGIPTLKMDCRKISPNVTLEAICHSSNLVDSTERVRQSELPFMKQFEDRNNCGLFQSSSLSSASRDKIQLPAWLKNAANCISSQPSANENSVTVTADKYPRVHDVKSKNSWKKCSAHVYISRLIKVLQISEGERKDDGGLLEKPTPSRTTHGGGVEIVGPNVSTNNQKREEIKGRGNSIVSYNGRLLQDQQLASKTSSTKLVSDFLSLGHHHEAPRNYQVSYLQSLQSQIHSNCTPFSLPPGTNFQGSTSDVAAAQQVPPYLSSSTMAPWGQQQQQKRMMIPLLQYKYNNDGGGATLAEWQNPNSVLNYAHQFSPHLESKYHNSSSISQLMAISSSRLDHQHRLQPQERWFFATPTNLM